MKTRSSSRHVVPASWVVTAVLGVVSALGSASSSGQTVFRIEESTIEDVHDAIRRGDTTCVQVVQAYVDRARAYNGMCTQLVTEDGKAIPEAKGAVRAGAPLAFPSTTEAVSAILPDYEDYEGLPGFNRIVYEPAYALNEKTDAYERKTGRERTELDAPLPVGISFWAGPGDEPILLRAASAYEAATRHRMPPPDFGPVAAAVERP